MAWPYLDTLPSFLIWFAVSLALTASFLGVYLLVTPQRELRLIRQGNVSAAVSFSGALLGFLLPVASAVAHGVNLADLLTWGLVALGVQVSAHIALRLVLPELPQAIEADQLSVAILAGALALGVGILNAACMTY